MSFAGINRVELGHLFLSHLQLILWHGRGRDYEEGSGSGHPEYRGWGRCGWYKVRRHRIAGECRLVDHGRWRRLFGEICGWRNGISREGGLVYYNCIPSFNMSSCRCDILSPNSAWSGDCKIVSRPPHHVYLRLLSLGIIPAVTHRRDADRLLDQHVPPFRAHMRPILVMPLGQPVLR